MHKIEGDDYLFYSYFDYLCKRKGVSKNKACTEMGLSRSVAAKWKSTDTNPNMETLMKIADYFEISLDELIAQGGQAEKTTSESESQPTRSKLNKEEIELIDLFNSLNRNGKIMLLDAARAFVHSGMYTDE